LAKRFRYNGQGFLARLEVSRLAAAEKVGLMDAQFTTERRRFRRADLELPVTVRPLNDQNVPGEPVICQLREVSLAGLYCSVKAPSPFKLNDHVVCSVSVPRERTRVFPFTRLHSKGWVVRVEPVPAGRRAGESSSGEQMVGLAVAFASDATALATFE
jgi:hypothetical protein